MNIGIKTLTAISDQLKRHLTDYQAEIDKAYCAADDLTISLSAKLLPSEAGVKIATSITFVESKVKDGGIIVVDEKQETMFDK